MFPFCRLVVVGELGEGLNLAVGFSYLLRSIISPVVRLRILHPFDCLVACWPFLAALRASSIVQ